MIAARSMQADFTLYSKSGGVAGLSVGARAECGAAAVWFYHPQTPNR